MTICPLFDDEYLKRLYWGMNRSAKSVAQRYAHRVRELAHAVDADMLWIEKEVLPYLPFRLERALMPRGVPYMVDYDDAVFHNYDLSDRLWMRVLLGRKIDQVMAGSAMVTCGNDYLAKQALRAGARRVEYLPSVVDTQRYPVAPSPKNNSLVIGWIGSPSTQHYVTELSPVLARLGKKHGARLVLVGAQPQVAEHFDNLAVQVLPWSEATEVEQIARFDIGIMPLRDGCWERGKCGYKLIQYMACGKPVVASSVGVNPQIVEHGEHGFLVDTSEQWDTAIRQLAVDAELRRRMGQAGRSRVKNEYSLETWAPRLVRLLSSMSGSSST